MPKDLLNYSELTEDQRKDVISSLLEYSEDPNELLIHVMSKLTKRSYLSSKDVANVIAAWAKTLDDDEFTMLQEKLAKL